MKWEGPFPYHRIKWQDAQALLSMSKPRNPAQNRAIMNPDMLTKRLQEEKTRDLISLPTYGAGAVKGEVGGVGDSVSGKRDHLNRHTTEKWEGLGKLRNPVVWGCKHKEEYTKDQEKVKGSKAGQGQGFSKGSKTIARRRFRWPKHLEDKGAKDTNILYNLIKIIL